jgi:hypothetical protein
MVDQPNDILKPRIKYISKKVDPNLLLHAEDLLSYYSFDLGQQTAAIVLQKWAQRYAVQWIRLAIIEALYQGRYKAVSVEQILQLWTRRQQIQVRFDVDFEKLICEKLPRKLLIQNTPEGESAIAGLAAEIHARTRIHDDANGNNPAHPGRNDSNPSANQEAALAALARVVKNRQSLQPSVNAVINHNEANVENAAAQGKQQILADGSRSAIAAHSNHDHDQAIIDQDQDQVTQADRDVPAPPSTSDQPANPESPAAAPTPAEPTPRSIHQFTPNPLSPELWAKLKAASTETQKPD